MLSLSKLISSLNLVYYEYDEKKNMILLDQKYSNTHTLGELITLSYYLTNKKIKFDVLKDSSIIINKTNDLSFRIKNFFENCKISLKNKKENIFVLSDKKVQWAKNIPLFKIEHINKKLNLSHVDALVFTSKNAIEALNKISETWKDIPSYVISEQSGKLIKEYNGKLKFFSKERHGDEFANELVPLLEGKKVLYLRGEQVASDIAAILCENGIDCSSSIVYKNVFVAPKTVLKLPKNAKIIFSSPSCIEYFFKLYTWDPSFQAIVIGRTTAKHLPPEIKPFIADNTSLEGCVKKALEIG